MGVGVVNLKADGETYERIFDKGQKQTVSRESVYVIEGIAPEEYQSQRIIDIVDGYIGGGTTVMPELGDSHALEPGLLCVKIKPKVISTKTGTVEVAVTWASPDRVIFPQPPSGGSTPVEGILELDTTTVQVETNLDKDGKIMYVEYTYPANTPKDRLMPDPTSLTKKQIVKVQTEKQLSTYRLTKTETISSRQLMDKQDLYVNAVNNALWNGCPEETCCCKHIGGTTKDNQVYEVTYEFVYNPDKWWIKAAYIDPTTSLVPSDAILGNGIDFFYVKSAVSFNGLNISIT